MRGDIFDVMHMLYWWLMPPIVLACVAFSIWRWLCPIIGVPLPRVPGLARVALCVAGNGVITWCIEYATGAPIVPLAGLCVDVATFLIVAMPPRSYFQAFVAAVLFVQIALDAAAVLLTKMGVHGFELPIWQMMMIMGLVKLVALLTWLGGANAYARRFAHRTVTGLAARHIMARTRQGGT